VALAGRRIVLSFLGAGLDAAVVEKVAGQRKGPVRNMTYIEAFASSFLNYRWNNLEVEVDGRKLDGFFSQALMSAVTNYAHFFQLPSASGFQVYLFRAKKRSDLIRSLLHMGWKRRLDRACHATFPVREAIEIRAIDGRGDFQFDGEAGGPLPVKCIIEAGALEFLTP
jgi:diacylglycerol kinase family enzyme